MVFVLTYALYYCHKKPLHNFDMLPYMGVVLSYDNLPDSAIHRNVYIAAQQAVSPESFALMTDPAHALRKTVRERADRFIQYLAFFRVKPLYTYCSFLLFKSGVPLARAVFVPSLICYCLIAIVIFFWVTQSHNAILGAAATTALMIFPPVLEATRLATPDMLAAFLIVLAFYLFDRNVTILWVLGVLALAVLARIDSIVIAVALTIFYVVYKGRDGKQFLYAMGIYLVALCVYAITLLVQVNDNNGLDVFYGSLSEKFSLTGHVIKIFKGFASVQSNHLLPIVMIGGVLLWYNTRHQKLSALQFWWLTILFSSGIKYLLFPDLTTRFFLPLYFLTVMYILLDTRKRAERPVITTTER